MMNPGRSRGQQILLRIAGRSEGRAVLDSVNSHKSEISPILAEMLCISKLFKSLIFQVK
jgi:hypothetical protein